MTLATDLRDLAVDLARERVTAERERDAALADRLAGYVARATDAAQRAEAFEQQPVPAFWRRQTMKEPAAGNVVIFPVAHVRETMR